ncbi:MAG: cytochrome c biogenesis protein CcsA [Bacteroidia bacterium]
MQTIGTGLVTVLWVSGLWGAIAAWEAHRKSSLWQKAGWGAWIFHSFALLGTIGLLLYLLLTHRYEFHYAWAHGSKLLSVEYITAALWEGQEGSFLLWMLWHVVFGWMILAIRDEKRWALLAGLLATNGYLATFLLGVSLPKWSIIAGGTLIWGLWAAQEWPLLYRLIGAGALLGGMAMNGWWIKGISIAIILTLAGVRQFSFLSVVTAIALLLVPLGTNWGSFPFLYLWEVRDEVPPGFIPTDGNGLNPLLQSFWMVIHPPVLFSGYAAAALPFWEGLLILRNGELSPTSTRRLLRWIWLAVGLLGLGIGLGAYWAYETLNFGGYWNWDPVENASLAPWLVLVAAAHMLWVWRRQRKAANLALALTVLGFPLVLYSSYLTRSGILSDSSVHSFTDLGLGDWLLWGVGISLLGVGAVAWKALKKARLQSTYTPIITQSALAGGAALLVWIAIVLTIFTSLPAINKLLGTSWTLGSGALQVYYEWIGVFAVPLLGLMGYALVQAYRVKGWEKVLWGSALVLSVIVLALWWSGWDFIYHPAYRSLLDSSSWTTRLRAVLFLLLDDLLWGAALVSGGAALAVWLQRRRGPHLWAVIAHFGFALMIIGALLSSGYEKVLSQNLNPRSPATTDNLFIPRGGSSIGLGYFVRYDGLVEPIPPIRNLTPLLHEKGQTLWRFRDSLGFSYQVWLPDGLPQQGEVIHPVALSSASTFIESNLAILPIEPADRRYRYRVSLTSLDSARTYPLLLEADVSESSGLLAHPAHVRLWHGDLYVHITSLPKAEGLPLTQSTLALGLRDTATFEDIAVVFERLTEVENAPHPTFRAWLAVWKGLPELVQRFPVDFGIRDKELLTPSASVPSLGLSVQLESISVKAGKLNFRVALRRRPDAFITLKILYKPFIGLFWLGILLTLAGAFGAMFRHRLNSRTL